MSEPTPPTVHPHSEAASAGPAAGAPAPGVPDRRGFFARHKLLTGLLAVVALFVIAGVVGSGGDDEPTATGDPAAPAGDQGGVDTPGGGSDATPDATPVDDAPAVEAPGIGDPARDGKLEFVVTAVEPGPERVGSELLGAEPQGRFLQVHVTVTNIGDTAQYLSDSSQKLIDTVGREHSTSSAAIYLDTNAFLNQINPGNSVQGILLYDVPADAEPAAVELHDSMFSGGVRVALG